MPLAFPSCVRESGSYEPGQPGRHQAAGPDPGHRRRARRQLRRLRAPNRRGRQVRLAALAGGLRARRATRASDERPLGRGPAHLARRPFAPLRGRSRRRPARAVDPAARRRRAGAGGGVSRPDGLRGVVGGRHPGSRARLERRPALRRRRRRKSGRPADHRPDLAPRWARHSRPVHERLGRPGLGRQADPPDLGARDVRRLLDPGRRADRLPRRPHGRRRAHRGAPRVGRQHIGHRAPAGAPGAAYGHGGGLVS